MKENIRKEIMGMNLAELNELGEFIRDVKVMNAKSTIRVGMDVYVVALGSNNPKDKCCTKN